MRTTRMRPRKPFGVCVVTVAGVVALVAAAFQSTTPASAAALDPTVSMAAGGAYHSLVARSDGSVWAWGLNDYGQLGYAPARSSPAVYRSDPLPVRGPGGVAFLERVTGVAAGWYHSLARASDGTVWAWGRNSEGQMGTGATCAAAPFQARDCYGDSPSKVKGPGGTGALQGVVALAGGFGHSLAIGPGGTVWAWGSNVWGQLGNGGKTSATGCFSSNICFYGAPVQVKDATGTGYLTGVTAIAAGYSHSLAVRSDGTLWAWGINDFGQLGTGSTAPSALPVQVTGLSGVSAAAAGASHSLAVASDGGVWAWGFNYHGQLGNGSTISSPAPLKVLGPVGGDQLRAKAVVAGEGHSIALTADGALWGFGRNDSGQLGNGSTTASRAPVRVKGPAGVGSFTGAVEVAAGGFHVLGRRLDVSVPWSQKQIWAWGSNVAGQLGVGAPGAPSSSTTPALAPLVL